LPGVSDRHNKKTGGAVFASNGANEHENPKKKTPAWGEKKLIVNKKGHRRHMKPMYMFFEGTDRALRPAGVLWEKRSFQRTK